MPKTEPRIELTVNGRIYGGWKSATIERSIDIVAGSFSLSVSDRWAGQRTPWQILEGDECVVSIGGKPVITGFVDERAIELTATSHSFSVMGRDRAADLVDCSAVPKNWEFANQRIDAIARTLTSPFGVPVAVASGLSLPPPRAKFAVNHGETVWDSIERLCRLEGVLAMSDGAGGVLFTRTPAGRATTALVEGKNIKVASGSYDISGRFARYIVAAQSSGTDEVFGEAVAQVQAEARDENVRAARVRIVRGEGNMTIAEAQLRANWEATVRAARSGSATVRVQGWTQADGTLWPLNALVSLRCPTIGIESDMLIVGTTLTVDDELGTETQLALARPDAYIPEPLVEKNSDPQSGDPFATVS